MKKKIATLIVAIILLSMPVWAGDKTQQINNFADKTSFVNWLVENRSFALTGEMLEEEHGENLTLGKIDGSEFRVYPLTKGTMFGIKDYPSHPGSILKCTINGSRIQVGKPAFEFGTLTELKATDLNATIPAAIYFGDRDTGDHVTGIKISPDNKIEVSFYVPNGPRVKDPDMIAHLDRYACGIIMFPPKGSYKILPVKLVKFAQNTDKPFSGDGNYINTNLTFEATSREQFENLPWRQIGGKISASPEKILVGPFFVNMEKDITGTVIYATRQSDGCWLIQVKTDEKYSSIPIDPRDIPRVRVKRIK